MENINLTQKNQNAFTGYIDIGANLTHEQFNSDRETVIESAIKADVSAMVVTGSTLAESEKALMLAKQYPNCLYATAGIHPLHADEWQDDFRYEFKRLLTQDEVKAVGETGLDFFRNLCPQATQEKAFEAQIELAIELQMPMFLHQREAHHRFQPILKNARDKLTNVVVHCFTDNQKALYDYLDLDCHIGITGWICDERRGQHLTQLVANIPDNRLLIETDAPYLLPRDLPQAKKTRRNLPQYLPHIAEKVAQYREQTPEH